MSDLLPIKLTGDTTKVWDALGDIVDSVHKGVKKLVEVCAWEALRDRVQHLALEKIQNEKDQEALKLGEYTYNRDARQLVLPEVARGRIMEKADNLLSAQIMTAELLENVPEKAISDEPVDKDFYNQWASGVEEVSSDEFRGVWARLLVEEVKKSGVISKRTLDVVKKMSKREAELFSNLALYCICGRGFITHKDTQKLTLPYGLQGGHDELMTLVESGLISESGTLGVHLMHNFRFNGYFGGKKIGYIETRNKNLYIYHKKEISLSALNLTRNGIEIMSILNEVPSREMLVQFAKKIKSENPDIEIGIADAKEIPGDKNNIKIEKLEEVTL